MELKRVKSALPPGQYFLQGDEACAEGAIAAGCRFYAAYPITPASEIALRMVQRLEQVGGVFVQMEDEIAALGAVIGASWTGKKAMTATSGPGFSLMQEGIGYAAMTETPCVIIDVQRAGPATGQATKPAQGDIMQARWGSHGDYQIIALSPWSIQECYEETIRAFNLAERFRVPVIVLADELVGHLRENLKIDEYVEIFNRKSGTEKPPFGGAPDEVPPMPAFGEGAKLLVTGSTHDEWGYRKTACPKTQEKLVRRLSQKSLAHKEEIAATESYYLDDAEILLIAFGFTARSALAAAQLAREASLRVGLLRLKTLWPFPGEKVVELGARCSRIIVPEMNLGQLVCEVERWLSREKVSSLCKVTGEAITPEEIFEFISSEQYGHA
jgi:2-oxoglutarate ferredoxin oxidoreductase subunit alpha